MPWIIEYESEEPYPPNPSMRADPNQTHTTWKPHGTRGRPYEYGTKESAYKAMRLLVDERQYRIREVPYT